MKRSKKCKVLMVVGIVVALFLSLYLLLLVSTNSVVEYVESVFKGAVPRDELPACLESYDITENQPYLSEVDVTITRRFVLHNFSEGYMWVKFTVEGHTSDGSPGYGEVTTSRWKIQKSEDGWEVVEIKDWWKTDSFWYKLGELFDSDK